jgi:hypothetical protein
MTRARLHCASPVRRDDAIAIAPIIHDPIRRRLQKASEFRLHDRGDSANAEAVFPSSSWLASTSLRKMQARYIVGAFVVLHVNSEDEMGK